MYKDELIMCVYRLEYKGYGPYRTEEYDFLYRLSWYNRMLEEHDNSIVHPTGRIDFYDQYKFGNNSRFGCKSLEDIINWFDIYLYYFGLIGANIIEYEVESFILGKSELQLIFDISTAKVLREINILHMLENITK